MEVTEVRVFPVNEEKLKAYATVTFDDCFVVRDLKVIHGNSGLFVAMPSKKRKDGTFKDVAHPLNNEFRAKIETAVLDAYEREKGALPPAAPAPQAPKIESKTPDQIKPEDYAAPDD
ncbi:septation protein SpoVG [Deltaproteobacteria bacterium PRO3]|nr:septation protein SpoVG [Deltaproteobacteria bacterium PRO3]